MIHLLFLLLTLEKILVKVMDSKVKKEKMSQTNVFSSLLLTSINMMTNMAKIYVALAFSKEAVANQSSNNTGSLQETRNFIK